MRFEWMEKAIANGKATLSDSGALVVTTGQHTGRAANSRFVVQHAQSQVDWGDVNKPFSPAEAEKFFGLLKNRLSTEALIEVNSYVGPFQVQVQTPSSWHAMFAENMFRHDRVETLHERVGHLGDRKIEIWHDPNRKASDYGVTSPGDAFILLDVERGLVGIVGTQYAGEIKKSAFSMCNYLLPSVGILPMHASANCQQGGDNSCVLFGLSGTGKTTLSADPERWLIGDDEIIWSDIGLTNLEGGCYA